ncbi:AAA family ATPase [Longispora sp. NPDC051575]|uniref:helix-turn-helix transcriptional regulator n=1 Tax=Longispora sp. NPDC051575 TaxID=3154943 RepID=UPI003423F955
MQITSPVVVGRELETARLEAVLRHTAAGSGRAVFLVGVAGIGKSRLSNETAYRAFAAKMPVLRGRASTTGTTTPFRPLAEALSSLIRVSGPPEDPELAAYRPTLARLVPEWRTGGVTPAVNPVDLAEALLRLLSLVGRERGCVLVLEDLHDGDAESLAVIEYLVDNLAGLPIMLLASLRPGPGSASRMVDAAAQRRTALLLEPQPLTSEQVGILAANCLGTGSHPVPPVVLERLVRDADGNPFVVEELLNSMITSGVLVRDARGWSLRGVLDAQVPSTVVRSVSDRVARLGSQAGDLLRLAAVLGYRFPLAVLQAATGMDDRALLGQLRAATDAQLIVPDGSASDWYTFRHALTADALLTELMPVERSALARRAADAMDRSEQAPSEEWVSLLTQLRVTAGQTTDAARLLAEAGRRTLATGASTSALILLERAFDMHPDAVIHEVLLQALCDAGQLDRALSLVAMAPQAAGLPTDIARRAGLHTRVAWAAVVAERPDDAAEQVAAARRLLGGVLTPAQACAIDAVEARLAFRKPGPPEERAAEAERLARRAAEVAEQVPLPEVACQAWQQLAGLTRSQGYEEADRCLERILEISEKYQLSAWRVDALIRLGVNEFIRTGEADRILQAREVAGQLGSIVLGMTTDVLMCMLTVMRGDYATAEEVTDRCEKLTARMQNVDEFESVLIAKAALGAHRGRRRDMDHALATLSQHVGNSTQQPLILGMCRAVCALLEEDPRLAAQELDAALAWELANPTVYYLTGRYGLRLLVEVAAGRAGWEAHDEVTLAPTSNLRWNQQFVLFARAILHGRSGRPAEATAAFEAAAEAAGVFPVAAHLGRRLVAEAAIVDGWGEPAVWLRAAEEYFHTAEVPAVASACRALLRRAGASAVQRRAGRDQIPAELRACGVTVREYEVFELLADHPGNQGIAKRLYISPRTVEKHVASLLAKTGHPDRAALSGFARQLLA